MATATLDPPSRVRVTTRFDEPLYEMVEDAAACVGVPVNSFIVSAVTEKAGDVLARERSIKLTVEDAKLILDLLENPPAPSAALVEAGRLYREMMRE
jgi:uncharacterized protein (DUF1778 family)